MKLADFIEEFLKVHDCPREERVRLTELMNELIRIEARLTALEAQRR